MNEVCEKDRVSIVVPVYNQAQFLGEAVRSCLSQTYCNVEVIVVDDGSSDNVDGVIAQFSDKRLKVVKHRMNLGLSAARNDGIRASTGEWIAFLDGDDYFSSDKAARHVEFFNKHPEVGAAYNARFDLGYSRSTIRGLWRPAVSCSLEDLVGGFPFAPSDMVVRRVWFSRVGLFDEGLRYFSEDLDMNCRLALAGCRFASVDLPLNFRRYHSDRRLQVRRRLDAALGVVDRICRDSRCPREVVAQADRSRAVHYLVWAFHAFRQNETALGRAYLEAAASLDESYRGNGGEPILRFMLFQTIADENFDHRLLLKSILDQFPLGFPRFTARWEKTAASGYLLRAVAAAMWGRVAEASSLFATAKRYRAEADEELINYCAVHLLNSYELLGRTAAGSAIGRIESLGNPLYKDVVRRVKACYHFNMAFRSFQAGYYYGAVKSAGRAVVNNVHHTVNRGLGAVVARSLWHMATSR